MAEEIHVIPNNNARLAMRDNIALEKNKDWSKRFPNWNDLFEIVYMGDVRNHSGNILIDYPILPNISEFPIPILFYYKTKMS